MEDDKQVDYTSLSLLELWEIIDKLEDTVPKDRRTVQYKDHLRHMNELFSIYNEKADGKIFKLIKL